MAHGFQLSDEAALPGGVVAVLVEVVAAQVVIGLTGAEEVPGDDEDGVADGHRRPLGSAAPRRMAGTFFRPRLLSMKRSGSPAGCDTKGVL